jgi:DNA polymerase-1
LWYSCRDADATIRIYNLLNPLIDQMGLRFILDYIDLPILPIALEMQRNGLPANPGVFQSLTREIRARMDFLETRLHYLAGEALHKPNPHVFNPNSTMQRAQIFYGSRADGFLGLKPTRYTKESHAPSTTTTELKKIVHPEAQPLIEPLCEYIEDLNLLSTYTAPLAKLAESGRIRYSIRTTRTVTGRLSTHDPNVMSIPVRSELGRRVRSGFEAPDGWLLVGEDYSQIEMRVAAHVTNCKSMIEIMNQGRDIHTETTLAIFGVSLEQAKDPKFRTPTKILNFGVMYGMTSRGLLDALREAGMDNWNTAMADEFIEDYFSLRPEIKTWQSALLSEATRKGYVSDMFGRIRRVPELRSPIRRVKAEGERNTVNMPIQSGAQGIIKRAMTNIWSRYYPAWNDFARWLLQVHDELIFEVREDMVPVVEAAFSYEMANAIKLSVPLEISVHHGKNWMELK